MLAHPFQAALRYFKGWSLTLDPRGSSAYLHPRPTQLRALLLFCCGALCVSACASEGAQEPNGKPKKTPETGNAVANANALLPADSDAALPAQADAAAPAAGQAALSATPGSAAAEGSSPADAEPSADEPGTDEPGADEPGADEPGASNPNTEAVAGESGGAAPSPAPDSAFDCPEVPTAYVFERAGKQDAAQRLQTAGFDVQPLPLDESPWGLRGAIVLGSRVSERPEYARYMEEYAADLYNFVDEANLLLALTQKTDIEATPPFLPSTHGARRTTAKQVRVRIANPDRSLTTDLPAQDGLLTWPTTEHRTSAFSQQDGFEILLELDNSAHPAVLMQGAYGQGRIVLSQLAFDAPADAVAAQSALADQFFENLYRETNNVCRRNTEALEVSANTITGTLSPNSEVIAVLPDTQVYSLRYPGLFTAQTAFLAQNVESLNIKYVFHLGDIVNNNTELEWKHAAASMSLLHGQVPYAIVPGNHDYGPSGDASTRDTLFNEYFRARDQAWHGGLGGVYEAGKLDNSYHLLTIAGHDYVLLALEWGPRDEVLDWANSIMEKHPERLGMLITHAYMYNDEKRYDHTDTSRRQNYNPHNYATPGGVNDGEEIWQKLVRHHPFVLTINGHVIGDGTGYLVSETDSGTTCHQILVNYQMRKLGGEAYMRLFEFTESTPAVRIWSYSPLYDDFMRDTDQQFEIESFPQVQ